MGGDRLGGAWDGLGGGGMPVADFEGLGGGSISEVVCDSGDRDGPGAGMVDAQAEAEGGREGDKDGVFPSTRYGFDTRLAVS